MKRYYILALAILCSVLNVLAANDLIIKTNSEKIEALIQEVGETELRYKKADNPNGPVYVLKTAEISTIVYANGEVQVMESVAAPQPQAQPQTVQPYSQPKPVQSYSLPAAGSTYTSVFFPENKMRKEGKIYYLGKKPMTRNEMREFMRTNCDQAYQQYLRNRRLERGGWAMFGIGAGLAIGGGVMNYLVWKNMRYNTNPQYTQATYDALSVASFVISGVGGGLFVASIPMICVGAVRKNNIHKTYNIWCAEEDKATSSLYEFNLTSGTNGLGIAMTF